MKTLFKIILGSAVRHVVTGLLTLLAAKGILNSDLVKSLPIESAISNDYVFDGLAAVTGAVLPVIWASALRLRSKLKQRLALRMPAHTSEDEVKAMISEAPLGARIAATLTADPTKL